MLSAMHYQLPDRISIFISYAQKDERWYEALEDQLAYPQRRGAIEILSRQSVLAGARKDLIAQQIDAARLILLLISPNFWVDEHCIDEMHLALQRLQDGTAEVIPVILDRFASIDWEETELGQLSSLPAGAYQSIKSAPNPGSALYEVAAAIIDVVKTLQQKSQQALPRGYRPLIGEPPLIHQANTVQRTQLVQQLYHRLTGPAISAVALVGIRGIGKSSLAAQLYDYAEQQRAAGSGPLTGKALWLQIDSTVTLADIAGTLREEWQLSPLNLASMTIEQISHELTRTLQIMPCLVILDQFEDLLDPQTGRAHAQHAGINEWLDALNTQPCVSRLLLTSRFSPHISRPASFLHEYAVPPLTVEEGKALLHAYNIEATESEMRLTVERCHGHALVLILVSQLLHKDRSIRLADLFVHPWFALKRSEIMAQELLNYIFTHQLNQDQRDLLSAFAVYREEVPVEAAQAVIAVFSDMPLERITLAHSVLLAQYLLLPMGERRYKSHDLISEFVCQKMAERPDQKKLWQRAHIQAARYYQQQARQPAPQKMQRKGLASIHNAIEAIWHLCQARRQRAAYTIMVQESIFSHLQNWGSNSILLELYQDLDPSRWKPSQAIAARIYNEIGEIYQAIGKWHDAGNNFELALDGFRALDQQNDIVDALNNLGTAYHQQGRIEDALACFEEARRVGATAQVTIRGRGTTLNNLGYVQSRLGHQQRRLGNQQRAFEHYQQALALYQQALPLLRAAGQFREEARTLNNIGEIAQTTGQTERAYTYYRQALTCAHEHEERWIEAMVLNNLGVLARKNRFTDVSSLNYYKQALALFRAMGAQEGARTVLKNLGYWYLVHREHETALACFVLARNISHELDDNSDAELPAPVLGELRLSLGEQPLQALLRAIEARAEQMVEQILRA